MSRHVIAAVLAVCAVTWPALAEQAAVPAKGKTEFFIVEGLAPGDLLNIRATASATGMLIGRLPNGSKLENLGCGEIDGYEWCKVSDPQAEHFAGWAPARYLVDFGSGLDALPEGAAPTEAAAAPVAGEDAFDASGEIPCAREFGQPMTLCHADVKRLGAAEADVVVVWPDGSERVIRFREGKPESSDAAEDIRVSREADLHMIRIGKSERFEIPDSLALGG